MIRPLVDVQQGNRVIFSVMLLLVAAGALALMYSSRSA